MPTYSKHEVILVQYPFSDLSGAKIRPAVVVNAPHTSQDAIIVPLTSRIHSLLSGEFILENWAAAGLNTPTAVKRGLYTIHQSLVRKTVGTLETDDGEQVERALRVWLGL